MEDVVDIEITSPQVRRLEDTDDPDWIGTGPKCTSHGLVAREAAESLVARGDARYRTLEETGDESITHPDAEGDEKSTCQATTVDGDSCKNAPREGSDLCAVHAPDDEGEE